MLQPWDTILIKAALGSESHKGKMLYLHSFLRKGVSLGYVGRKP